MLLYHKDISYINICFRCSCLKSRTISLARRADVETDRDGGGQSPCPARDRGHVHWQARPIGEKSDNLGDEMLIQNTLHNTTVLITNQETGIAITQM